MERYNVARRIPMRRPHFTCARSGVLLVFLKALGCQFGVVALQRVGPFELCGRMPEMWPGCSRKPPYLETT
jgi:hypothetical protein